MNSNLLVKYSEDEDMCTYDTFIHKSGDIPNEIIEKIKLIIHQAVIKIKTKELENNIESDEEYQDLMKDI